MAQDTPDSGASPAPRFRKPRRVSGRTGAPRRDKVFSDLAGVFVLALGLGVFAAIAFWGYTQYAGPGRVSSYSNEAGAARDVRQNDIAGVQEADFQGRWEAVFDGGQSSAVIIFQDGLFRLVLFTDIYARRRLYSFGHYVFDPDESVLELRPDSGQKPAAEDGVEYEVLTFRRYNVSVGTGRGEDRSRLFLKPSVQGGAHDQVHPLFSRLGRTERYIVWDRK